jgi:hypothetical protein
MLQQGLQAQQLAPGGCSALATAARPTGCGLCVCVCCCVFLQPLCICNNSTTYVSHSIATPPAGCSTYALTAVCRSGHAPAAHSIQHALHAQPNPAQPAAPVPVPVPLLLCAQINAKLDHIDAKASLATGALLIVVGWMCGGRGGASAPRGGGGAPAG